MKLKFVFLIDKDKDKDKDKETVVKIFVLQEPLSFLDSRTQAED